MKIPAITIKLLNILKDNQFHSGEKLATKFNITRSAIWKHIQQLNQFDLQIESVTGKGYRLINYIEFLNHDLIWQHLNDISQRQLANLQILTNIDSTNNYLMDLAKNLPPKSTNNIAVFAEHQSAGRGRRGRAWVSPFATNIYFSLLWHFNKDPAEIMGLSLAVGVAVTKALQRYGIKEGIQLKWPNDVLWQGKKLAGILIDMLATSNEKVSTIIGIGINTAMPSTQTKTITQPWTSIKQITGETVSRNHLASLLLNNLIITINQFSKSGLTPILRDWEPLDALLNHPVRIINNNIQIDGIMTGISPAGELLLKDNELKEHRFFSGEVSVRLT